MTHYLNPESEIQQSLSDTRLYYPKLQIATMHDYIAIISFEIQVLQVILAPPHHHLIKPRRHLLTCGKSEGSRRRTGDRLDRRPSRGG